jgi:dethiobiotin synthetase
MHQPIFITGIGTGIGKTLTAAIVAQALGADYWKPVQAGIEEGTDTLTVKNLLSNATGKTHAETYRLAFPASPHIAAQRENIHISLERIYADFERIKAGGNPLVIEGAGGILVPLNSQEFVSDLIRMLQASVILVSRNYLGSISHSLLTAAYCKSLGLHVLGWIFNDQYLDYEEEIAQWSGFPRLGSIPAAAEITPDFVREQAMQLRPRLLQVTRY